MDMSTAKTDVEQTLNASAFSRLRADILSCQLLPNERLRMENLRERYGMGASPIREALMRLEAEGLGRTSSKTEASRFPRSRRRSLLT